jgi:hypothetical protein
MIDRNTYLELLDTTLKLSNKSIKKGLGALEEDLQLELIYQRNILHYGLRLFLDDSLNKEFINRVLINIINQEKDLDKKEWMILQREALICICDEKLTDREIIIDLNSLTNFNINEDLKYFHFSNIDE